MYDLLYQNPWLIVIGLGVMVPISAIVFGSITNYLQRARRDELEASLKHAMLEKGMSAQDIKMVLEATAGRGGSKKQCSPTEPGT